jgi:threonine aldolase
VKSFKIDLESVQTNIVIVDIDNDSIDAFKIVERLKENNILAIPFGTYKIRFVTHLNISHEDVETCLRVITRLFR